MIKLKITPGNQSYLVEKGLVKLDKMPKKWYYLELKEYYNISKITKESLLIFWDEVLPLLFDLTDNAVIMLLLPAEKVEQLQSILSLLNNKSRNGFKLVYLKDLHEIDGRTSFSMLSSSSNSLCELSRLEDDFI
jgi:hypothetical protein